MEVGLADFEDHHGHYTGIFSDQLYQFVSRPRNKLFQSFTTLLLNCKVHTQISKLYKISLALRAKVVEVQILGEPCFSDKGLAIRRSCL